MSNMGDGMKGPAKSFRAAFHTKKSLETLGLLVW
jgi:hypothetical protein